MAKYHNKVLLTTILVVLGIMSFSGVAMAETTPISPTLSNPTHKLRIVPNGKEYSVCVTATSQAGDTMTIGYTANYGKYLPPNEIFVSDGTNIVCSFYKAPKNRALVGKTGIFVFTIVDDDTGVRGKALTASFVFRAPRCQN